MAAYEAEAVLDMYDDIVRALVEDAVACLGVQGVADAVGVSVAAVRKWLSGESRPGPQTLRRLAHVVVGGCSRRPRFTAAVRRLHRRTAELLAALEAAARRRG